MEAKDRRSNSLSNRIKRYEGTNVMMELSNYYYFITNSDYYSCISEHTARSKEK